MKIVIGNKGKQHAALQHATFYGANDYRHPYAIKKNVNQGNKTINCPILPPKPSKYKLLTIP